MSRVSERIYAALEEADVDQDESQNFDNATGGPDALAPEPPSDPVAPQIIQAAGALGSAFDSAKFSITGGQDAMARIGGMLGDVMQFTKELGELTRLPPEAQQAFEQHQDGFALTRVQDIVEQLEAFEQHQDGFALTRVQDIVEQLEAFEQHMTDARKMLTQAVKDVDRYRADIKEATTGNDVEHTQPHDSDDEAPQS